MNAESVQEMPEVLALLLEVITKDETGIVTMAESRTAHRLGSEVTRRSVAQTGHSRTEAASATSGRQQAPMSVQDIDAIIAAIVSYSDSE